MRRAQFEEAQYADAANAELTLGTGLTFNPGLVLEALLGFDVASDPSAAWVWAALRVRAKQGVHLHSGMLPHWRPIPHLRFPPSLVSVFFQYKRPHYFDSPADRHWAHWNQPYFEFSIRKRQHPRLQSLERAVRRNAVVRYACPAFWQTNDLFARQMARRILASSAFVAPGRIDINHTKWTYTESGTKGLANPDPEETTREGWEDLGAVLADASREQSLVEHVGELAGQIREGRLGPVAAVLPESMSVPRGVNRENWTAKLRDLLTITGAAERVGARWMVIGFHRKNQAELTIQPDAHLWWYWH